MTPVWNTPPPSPSAPAAAIEVDATVGRVVTRDRVYVWTAPTATEPEGRRYLLKRDWIGGPRPVGLTFQEGMRFRLHLDPNDPDHLLGAQLLEQDASVRRSRAVG